MYTVPKLRWNRKGPKGTTVLLVEDTDPQPLTPNNQDFIGRNRNFRNSKKQALVEKKRNLFRLNEPSHNTIAAVKRPEVGEHWRSIASPTSIIRIDAIHGECVTATYIANSPNRVGKTCKFEMRRFRPLQNGWEPVPAT